MSFFMLLAIRFASPLIVCVPVKYVPLAIVWLLVPGVIVAAALRVALACNVMLVFPDVPLAIYPAVTSGTLLTLLDKIIAFVPVDNVAPVEEIDAAGFALPLEIDFVASLAYIPAGAVTVAPLADRSLEERAVAEPVVCVPSAKKNTFGEATSAAVAVVGVRSVNVAVPPPCFGNWTAGTEL